MRRNVIVAAAALAVAALCVHLILSAKEGSRGGFLPLLERTAVVHRIIDGDTIELEGGERVRLVGINAPELHPEPEPGALEAVEFLENICPPGTVVGLNVDDMKTHDVYGRTLAVVYVRTDGSWVNVNAELLRRGLAVILFIPPSEFNPWEWLENS